MQVSGASGTVNWFMVTNGQTRWYSVRLRADRNGGAAAHAELRVNGADPGLRQGPLQVDVSSTVANQTDHGHLLLANGDVLTIEVTGICDLNAEVSVEINEG